jgi:hypothetical protein
MLASPEDGTNIPELAKLFDHLVGDREHVLLRNGKTERLGGL